MTGKAVRARRALFTEAVPAPEWIDAAPDGDLTAAQGREYADLIKRACVVRAELWRERQQPGTRNPPAGFSLLPMSPLQPCFIALSPDAIAKLCRRSGQPVPEARKARNPWSRIFDLYTKRHDPAPPTAKNKRAPGRRGLLRTRRTPRGRLLRGIRLLHGTPWVTDDAAFERRQRDPATPVPWLVNNIKTDGCRVHTTLVTLGDAHGGPPAPARHLIVKKGYKSITKEFVAGEHTRGIFKSARALPADLVEALDKKDPACFVEVVGVDPGGKVAITSASARVTSGTTHESFKDSVGGVKKTSTYDLKFFSLRTAALKFETRRRQEHAAYGESIARLAGDGASLKTAAGTPIYSNIVYEFLEATCAEKLSDERREWGFAQQRAVARQVDRMARDLAGADPDAAAVRREGREGRHISPERAALATKMRESLKQRAEGGCSGRTWVRVVFFGNAQFGHGANGPVPRKALLTVLSARCVVILTDEFRTSIRCCGCGGKMGGAFMSRIFRCPTGEDETAAALCSVNYIDRDVNASVNIAMCGVSQLLGRPRPPHLARRSTAAAEEEDEDDVVIDEGVAE
jgi:hypothetical protein